MIIALAKSLTTFSSKTCRPAVSNYIVLILGRYRGIRRPLAQRMETEHSVLGRIVLTWGLGMDFGDLDD